MLVFLPTPPGPELRKTDPKRGKNESDHPTTLDNDPRRSSLPPLQNEPP